jgi:uncharacterized protein YbjT (DUF2867 family)
MILVTGGTGRLGAWLVPGLVAKGLPVRVLTRDRARARGLPAGVEIVTGDVRSASDIARAVAGCRMVISAAHGFAGPGNPSPEAIDRDANRTLIQAATKAGVERFILISVQGVSADHPMSLHRAKYAAEEALRASGLGYTILRPTAFLETWLDIIGAPLATGGRALVFGPGKNPVNFVSVRDVAALTLLAVEQETLRGDTIEIGGPEDSSFVDLAQRLIAVHGKPAGIQHIPLPMLRALSVLARPFSPEFARKAGAAVVLNTADMSFADASRKRFPSLPRTTAKDVLAAGGAAP